MQAHANLQQQRAAAEPSPARRAHAERRSTPATEATDRLARALDGNASVAATRRLQRSFAGGATTPALVRRRAAPATVQRNGDFDEEKLEQIHDIARRFGVDPSKLTFNTSGDDYSQSVDDLILLNSTMTDEELEFVLGHELSHYKTGDNRNFPFSSIGLTGLLGATLGTALVGPLGALGGGVLGFGGELLGGGGLFNALLTGLSTAGMLGLGPLGFALGGGLGGLIGPTAGVVGGLLGGGLGTLAGGLAGLPLISKLFEIKSDLHSAGTFGTRGGIHRFKDQIKGHTHITAPLITPGNGIFDPWHPPLSTRVAYLTLLNKVFGI